MQDYAEKRISALVAGFHRQSARAMRAANAEVVHDLRVSIRRLSRGLKVFAQFFPAQPAKRLRRDLSKIMDAAGALRDCDIALELLEKAGATPREPAAAALQRRRRAAAATLVRILRASGKAAL